MRKIGTKLVSLASYWIIVLIVLLLISLARNILRVVSANKKIESVRQEVTELEKENNSLQAQLEFVSSGEYLEKEARDKLGLAKEGEIVVILPDEEVLQKIAPVTHGEEFIPKSNWQKWLDLFL